MDTNELNPKLQPGIMPRQPSGGSRRLAMVYFAIGVFVMLGIAFFLFRIISGSLLEH